MTGAFVSSAVGCVGGVSASRGDNSGAQRRRRIGTGTERQNRPEPAPGLLDARTLDERRTTATDPVVVWWVRKGSLRLDDNHALWNALGASATGCLLPVVTLPAKSLPEHRDVVAAAADLSQSINFLGSVLASAENPCSWQSESDQLLAVIHRLRAVGLTVTGVHVNAPSQYASANEGQTVHSAHARLAALSPPVILSIACNLNSEAVPKNQPRRLPRPPLSASFARFATLPTEGPGTVGESFALRELRIVARTPQTLLDRSLRVTGSGTLAKRRFRRHIVLGSLSQARVAYEIRLANTLRFSQATTNMALASVGATATAALGAITVYDVSATGKRAFEWDEKNSQFKLRDRDWMSNTHFELKDMLRQQAHNLRGVFFPEDVTPDYYAFSAWRFFQRCVSATVGVFGTQSLLLAVGIKAGRIGQAATISWVLKDGLGRLGKMIWAGGQGKLFDVDPKRWRFKSALIYACGNGLEIMTRVFPGSFLLVATVGNATKHISMITASATRNAMYSSFSGTRNNIGNITAKGEAQIVVADLIGMTCGIQLSKYLGPSRGKVLAAYVVLSLADILCIYQELRQVVFRTLNPERASLVIEHFLRVGIAPTPSDVSRRESIFLRPKIFNPTTFCGLKEAFDSPDKLSSSLKIFRQEKFLVNCDGSKCNVVVRQGARNADVLRSLLTVGHYAELSDSMNSHKALEASLQKANKSFKKLLDSAQENGWDTSRLVFHHIPRGATW